MAQHDPRQGLDLNILQRRPLDGRKVAHLSLGEPDVLDRRFGQGRVSRADLIHRQPEVGTLPLVEITGEATDRLHPFRFDRGEHGLDGCADPRTVLPGGFDRTALLQPNRHITAPSDTSQSQNSG